MTERQLQFRVGLFVIASSIVGAVMVFHFGSVRTLWEPRYRVAVRFDSAPGVYPATPVRRNGITIGAVTDVLLDDEHGGVIVLVDIRKDVRLRDDVQPQLARTLLGDASLEFSGGKSQRYLQPDAVLRGDPPADPMELVARMEERVAISLESFNTTSREWQRVGKNLNSLMETNRGNLDSVIERSAVAMDQFTETMRKADAALVGATNILGDPENQENLRKTLAAMPGLVQHTRETIVAVRSAVVKADETLANVSDATQPLALRSTSIVTRLDNTLANLERVSKDMNDFTQLAMKEDGTIKQFATDPELYRNLNRSAESLTLLLQNLEPILSDVRIFSDKVARHPELLGVGGAMKGSSGVKDPLANPAPIRQTGGVERVRPR